MNLSHFVKICQVLTILHQLICRGVANFGTRCSSSSMAVRFVADLHGMNLLAVRLEGKPSRSVCIQSTYLQLLVHTVGGVSHPTADRQLFVDNAATERAGLDGDVSRLCAD